MWCSTCQQDVPGLGSPSGGELRCGKCGESLPAVSQQIAVTCAASDESTPALPSSTTDCSNLEKLLRQGPLVEDDWALEAELRGVQRLLGSLKSRSTIVAEPVAVHAPHAAPAAWHAAGQAPAGEATAPNTAADSVIRDAAAQPNSHLIAWMILSFGLATFACGAVLLGWSLVAKRDDLWPMGMPLALIGQAGLILGLVLQLDGLWHTNRKTARALSELDGELRNVRHVTKLLSTSHASSAQSFYSHLAESASPRTRLSDLKQQIDRLAHRASQAGS
jgi:hypothetical protein